MKTSVLLLILISGTLFSCATSIDKPPLNEITDLEQFTWEKVAAKFKLIEPFETSEIYGIWEMVAGFHATQATGKVYSFHLEGKKFDFKKSGDLAIDNSVFDAHANKDTKWKLKGNKIEFDEGKNSFYVRVSGNTMEWIIKSEDRYYLYFVLKREV